MNSSGLLVPELSLSLSLSLSPVQTPSQATRESVSTTPQHWRGREQQYLRRLGPQLTSMQHSQLMFTSTSRTRSIETFTGESTDSQPTFITRQQQHLRRRSHGLARPPRALHITRPRRCRRTGPQQTFRSKKIARQFSRAFSKPSSP